MAKLFGDIAPDAAAVRADFLRTGDRLISGRYQPLSLGNVRPEGETVTEVTIREGRVYVVGSGDDSGVWELAPYEVVLIEKES